MTELVRARAERSDRLIRAARWLGAHPFPALVRLGVHGTEHVPESGPALLVANHSGILDGPVLFAAAPREGRFLVKSELYSGVLGHLLARLDQVPVNRGRADRTALRSALDALQAGRLVGVFPEGTRGNGDVSRVQHGVGWLLARFPAPVVPVAVFGTGKGERGGIRVCFGAPTRLEVDGDPSARTTMSVLAEQVRVLLAEHVAGNRDRLGSRRAA